MQDQVGGQVRARRLDEDVSTHLGARAAHGFPDDPADGVACRDRARAGQGLAGLQGDVGDAAGRGIDLIEGMRREHIDLG